MAGSLARLNPRERILVFALIGIVLVLGLGGGVWYVRAKLSAKEDKIKNNRAKWAKIRTAAGPYLAERERLRSRDAQIRANQWGKSPDSPVSSIALKTEVRFRDRGEEKESVGDLGQILNDESQLKSTYVGKKKKKFPGYWRMDKTLEMDRYIRTDDIWSFLAKVEAMSNMVYVTKLSIVRLSEDVNYAKLKDFTVSTVRWVEKQEDM